jgi:transcriptional regulator of acetoin/glycerol metabolism
MEQQMIINALKASNGNKSKAAKQLGIARSTLYEKMYQYKLH